MSLTRVGVSAFVIAIALASVSIRATADRQNQDAQTYYDQGLTFFKAGKFDEAVKAFREATKLKPDFVDAYLALGDTYQQINEPRKGLEAYKQAVKYQPDSVTAQTKLATAYFDAGDYKKAAESYSAAIRLSPKAPELHFKLGAIYAYLNNEKAAVAEYQILQTLDASLAQDLYSLIYKPTVNVVAEDAVRLRVIVLDAQGAPVSGLKSEDFQVVEDNVPQTFSLSTRNDARALLAVAIDTSGSLRRAFPLVIAAAKFFVLKSAPADQTLLIRFISSDKIETVQGFTADKTVLTKGIDTLFIEGGQSAVVDAVYLTAQRLAGYKFPDSSPRRILILLSDGEDRTSYYSAEHLLKFLGKIDIQVFPISLAWAERGGAKLNQGTAPKSVRLLKSLAAATGGKAFFPKSTDELELAINQIIGVVHGHYTIEYKPSKPIEPGLYRSVAVNVSAGPGREGWTVAARSGYVFSKK